jgi:hypothetical protein
MYQTNCRCLGSQPKRRIHSWTGTLIVAAVVASLAVCGWLRREALLRGAASLWIVSDPITRADAIVVLGGNFQERPLMAAELYRRGLADKVLVSQTADVDSPSNNELNRIELLKLGVPPTAIEDFGTANKNTRDEAMALREWAGRTGASVFIIPCELFVARRVKWIFNRELSGNAVTIEVPSFEQPRYYARGEWWKTEYGVTAFQSELLKYLYYRLKY